MMKGLAISMGLGVIVGAVAVLMLPKQSAAHKLADKAANAAQDAMHRVTDRINNAAQM